MGEFERSVHNAKQADNNAISRKRKQVKNSPGFADKSSAEQEILIEHAVQEMREKR